METGRRNCIFVQQKNKKLMNIKGFIELTNTKQGMKQLINVNTVESVTQLTSGAIIHFSERSAVTVSETYDEIKQLIVEQSLKK